MCCVLIIVGEDETETWLALPYEIASAFVRTLMLHIQKLKEAYTTWQESGTKKAEDAYVSLKEVQRYIASCFC